jgi:protein-S-isoprenylcysteine O-methyltransferase Ste14
MKMLRHILAILILPGTVLVPVPIMLWLATDAAYPFWTLGFPLLLVSFVASIFCVAVGLTLMAKAISLFATVGEGTLAPWDPTQRLVVRGPYRHVRNPMISGVNFILLGESIGLGSWSIAFWFLAFFLTNVLYIRFVEEPGLVRRFGESYREYRRNVPAWIPRRTPWNPPT